MTKPLEQMTKQDIKKAKEHIAKLCGIGKENIQTKNEIDDRKCPSFVINYEGESEIDIFIKDLSGLKYDVRFDKCVFKNQIKNKECVLENIFAFYDCRFEQKVEILNSIFESILFIKGCHFQELNLSGCIFSHSLYCFNNTFSKRVLFSQVETQSYAIFKREVAFFECIFEKGISLISCTFDKEVSFGYCIFYGVSNCSATFEREIRFLSCVFGKVVSFEDSSFAQGGFFNSTTFESAVNFYGAIFRKPLNLIGATFKDEINLVNTKLSFDYKQLKSQIGVNTEASNDYRDSFRLIKNSLAKNGNTLDASQYHKMELYCKEIELESKEQKSLSDWLERWQLWFYRKTSDHHTDLLRIVGWVMACIGLFGLVSFGYRHGGKLIDSSEINRYPVMHFLEGLWGAEVYQASSESGFVLLAIGVSVAGLLSNFSRMILGVLLSLCVVISNPKNIFGVAKLFEGQKISGAENVIIFLYAFVMILLLFSLQKTARKNTITPS